MVEGAAGSWSPGGPHRELSLRLLEDRHRHLHYLPAPDLRPPCALLTVSSPDPGLAHRSPWARLTSGPRYSHAGTWLSPCGLSDCFLAELSGSSGRAQVALSGYSVFHRACSEAC